MANVKIKAKEYRLQSKIKNYFEPSLILDYYFLFLILSFEFRTYGYSYISPFIYFRRRL